MKNISKNVFFCVLTTICWQKLYWHLENKLVNLKSLACPFHFFFFLANATVMLAVIISHWPQQTNNYWLSLSAMKLHICASLTLKLNCLETLMLHKAKEAELRMTGQERTNENHTDLQHPCDQRKTLWKFKPSTSYFLGVPLYSHNFYKAAEPLKTSGVLWFSLSSAL